MTREDQEFHNQLATMDKTNPGRRIRLLMDAAEEMKLSHDDIRALVKAHPQRYTDLAVALGVEL